MLISGFMFCWMGVLFLDFCFLFDLVVFVAWISGNPHDLSSGMESLPSWELAFWWLSWPLVQQGVSLVLTGVAYLAGHGLHLFS